MQQKKQSKFGTRLGHFHKSNLLRKWKTSPAWKNDETQWHNWCVRDLYNRRITASRWPRAATSANTITHAHSVSPLNRILSEEYALIFILSTIRLTRKKSTQSTSLAENPKLNFEISQFFLQKIILILTSLIYIKKKNPKYWRKSNNKTRVENGEIRTENRSTLQRKMSDWFG